MNEIMTFGYCPVCGSAVTNEEDCYVNDDGEYFCDIDCLMEYYNIHKIET